MNISDQTIEHIKKLSQANAPETVFYIRIFKLLF